jgi:SAM-dependent methyltransferase
MALSHDNHTAELKRLLSALPARSSRDLFGNVSDDFWLWLNTEGYRQNEKLHGILPALPPEYFQMAVASLTGDETLRSAFAIYRFFRTLIEQFHKPVADCEAILDFGCGWGRITRFFLKDIEAEKLWGVDQWKELVELGNQTRTGCHFLHVNQNPPAPLSNEMFDVVFAYSVFSHIDENEHKRWLAEFKRILKPDGLLILTTWQREHIPFLEQIGGQQVTAWDDHYNSAVARHFPGTQKALADYDAGKYFHIDLGYPTYPTYGETCIPKKYVYAEWTKLFEVLDYIDDRSACEQDVIVCRRIP